MRSMRVLLMTALLATTVQAQSGYDAALASKLKADDNGMRTYVMALLKAGPNRDRPREEAQRLQAAHRANINRLASEGKLVLAGPFADDGALRGIYVFDVATVAEAEALTRTDPAIEAGQLVMELHPWYGTAALMMVNEVHLKIQKTRLDRGGPDAAILETTFRPSDAFRDVRSWVSRLAPIEQQVCLIRRANGQPLGTGFLVGPDLVLTGHHVVVPARPVSITTGSSSPCTRARDFAGRNHNRGVPLKVIREWLIGLRLWNRVSTQSLSPCEPWNARFERHSRCPPISDR